MQEKLKRLWEEYGTQAIIVVVGLGAILFVQGNYLTTTHRLEGQEAPKFSLALLDGGTMDLSEHLGQDVVILDFWTTWCGPCRESLPEVAKLHSGYGGKGVQVYAVNIQESPVLVSKFLLDLGVSLPVAMDNYGEIAMLYEAEYIPQTVLIGRDGLVAKVHVGPVRYEDLRAEVDALLSVERAEGL